MLVEGEVIAPSALLKQLGLLQGSSNSRRNPLLKIEG